MSLELVVNRFGTEKMKTEFAKNHKLKSNRITQLLNRASRENIQLVESTKVDKWKNHKYRVKQINYNDTQLIKKMNRNLYQFLIPSFLYFVCNGYNEKGNDKYTMTTNLLAMNSELVNGNYISANLHKTLLAKKLDINDTNSVYIYFEKVNNMINNAITQMLKYLKSYLCIEYEYVFKCKRIENIYVDSKSEDQVDIVYSDREYRDMTSSEKKLYFNILKELDEKYALRNEKERWFSKKSKDYKYDLKNELRKYGIDHVYKTFDIHIINIERCQQLLKQQYKIDIKKDTRDEIVSKMNDYFSNKINEKIEKNATSFEEYQRLLETYRLLTEQVIYKDADPIIFENIYHVREMGNYESEIEIKIE